MNWINIFGLIIIVLLLIPNAIYAYKNKNIENKCKNKLMNIIEQIGRYGSMLLMVFNIGVVELGFKSNESFAIWIISVIILMILYWIFWILYFKSKGLIKAMVLAIIPSIIFIYTGIMLRYWLLVTFGVLFAVGHIYVTYKNNK